MKCTAALASLAVLVLTSSAFAYIPSSKTIAGRLARGNGKGIYSIEQDVQFRTGTDPITLRERWIVENGETMRLSVSMPTTAAKGEAYRFEAVYRDGRRTAPDLHGSVHSLNVSPEFFESFFHTRSGRGFLDTLVRAHIVPGSLLHPRPFSGAGPTYRTLPEPLVRLGRTDGVVNYVFGEATPVDQKKQNPEAWIQQDEFTLRRLRFPSEAELTATHPMQSSNLKLPRERTLNWEGNSVFIRVVSVKPLSNGQAASLLNPASIGAGEAKAAHLPDVAMVREFYSRFR